MKKSVLHIVSGDLWGGAEAQVLFQAKALQTLGWDVQVLLFNQKETFARYAAAGLKCSLVQETAGIPVAGPRLLSVIRAIAPDVIASHGYKESLAAFVGSLFCAIPWVSTFHGSGENYRGVSFWKSRVYMNLYFGLSRYFAAKVITVSQALAQELGFAGLAKLEVVHNVAEPVDTHLLPAKQEGQGLLAARPAVVAVGRLAPVKRIDLALNAFAALSQQRAREGKEIPHLYLIGEGPEQAQLEELAARLSLSGNVHFLGFRHDAAELIAQADLLLISSDSEGIPTVILEAMAACTPLVSTDVGGINEVLARAAEYPARLVPKGDSAALAAAMGDMLNQQITPMQKEAVVQLFQLHFVPVVAAKKLEAIYCSVLRKK